jgi:hypothetical protein
MITLGQPVVAVNTVIMAASLTSVPHEELLEHFAFVLKPIEYCAGTIRSAFSGIFGGGGEENEVRRRSSSCGFDTVDEEASNAAPCAGTKSPTVYSTPGESVENPLSKGISSDQEESKSPPRSEVKKREVVKYHSSRLILIHTLCR